MLIFYWTINSCNLQINRNYEHVLIKWEQGKRKKYINNLYYWGINQIYCLLHDLFIVFICHKNAFVNHLVLFMVSLQAK